MAGAGSEDPLEGQGARLVSIWGRIKGGLKRAGQVLGGVVGGPVGTVADGLRREQGATGCSFAHDLPAVSGQGARRMTDKVGPERPCGTCPGSTTRVPMPWIATHWSRRVDRISRAAVTEVAVRRIPFVLRRAWSPLAVACSNWRSWDSSVMRGTMILGKGTRTHERHRTRHPARPGGRCHPARVRGLGAGAALRDHERRPAGDREAARCGRRHRCVPHELRHRPRHRIPRPHERNARRVRLHLHVRRRTGLDRDRLPRRRRDLSGGDRRWPVRRPGVRRGGLERHRGLRRHD